MTAEHFDFTNLAPAPVARATSKSASRLSALARSLYRLTGPATTAAFLASIPAGLLLGVVEVVTAYVLYLVLVKFNVLAAAGQAQWLPTFVDPLVMLAISVILTAALRYLVQVLPSMAFSSFECRIRKSLSWAALGGPGMNQLFSVAETSHIVNTLITKSGFFLYSLMTSLGIVSVLALMLIQMSYLSWKLTAIAMMVAVLLGAPILWLRRIYSRFPDQIYKFNREFVYRFLKDARNVLFLRICGLNQNEARKLDEIARLVRVNAHSYQLLFAIGSNLPFIAGAAIIAGLLSMNARFELMPISDLVPFVYLLNRVTGNVVVLSTTTGQFREAIPYVIELLGYEKILFPNGPRPAEDRGAAPQLSSLSVQDLRYGWDTPLTEPLSFELRSGQMVLISGPSGRGKTTLLMTLIGLIPPLGGCVQWDGVPLECIDAAKLRRRVGFAGSEPYLLDADIRTNLLFGLDRADRSEAEIKDALAVACAGFVDELDGGLGHVLRENGDGISAGQKQRVALARCILRRPQVLILDEATANLDDMTERAFFERLRKVHPAMMVIAVSHRPSLRAFATRFVEI